MRMAKQRFHNMERSVDQAVSEVKAAADARHALHKAVADSQKARQGTFDRDAVAGATEVQIFGYGWMRVTKLNKVTVEVANPYAWDGKAKYPFHRVIGVRP